MFHILIGFRCSLLADCDIIIYELHRNSQKMAEVLGR